MDFLIENEHFSGLLRTLGQSYPKVTLDINGKIIINISVFVELDEHGWSSGHLFVCQYCCSHVNSYGAFCEHMTSVHNARRVPSLYPCSTCNYVTDAQPDLERHSQIHNAPTSYKCPSESCFYIASEPEAITNHLKLECKTTNSQGTVQMMMCEACDFIAWDEKTFKEHCAQHVKAESPPPSNQVLLKKKKG